ncbi:MAG TPA: DNA repair protein RecN [Flavobacterium sp.]|jgi:DNA repair protein RecN (Recombination protein N)
MITSLSIENFALIEKLSINFSGGFSIITGETGAGKSILLGALGLVLGKRADLSSLKSKSEKCVIEAHFQISQYNLKEFFEAHDLDYDDETILRREILPSGKSRAFVNDSPVNLQELQDLGDFLIDIHSQHQTRELSEESFQFEILDAIAGNHSDLRTYSGLLKKYKNDKNELNGLQQQLQQSVKEQDYNVFLLEELLAAQLKAGEQEELEILYEQLNNVELIKEQLDRSAAIANDDEVGAIKNLKEIKLSLQKISSFSVEYAQLAERAASVAIEVADIIDEVFRLSENISQDPQQLETVNQKLQAIYNLQKKHQVTSVEELLTIQEELDNKALSQDSLQQQMQKLEHQIIAAEAELDAIAEKIHLSRESAVPMLSDKLVQILEQLGMPNVRFRIGIAKSESYFQNGKDELTFLFSANKGSDFGLLKKVASGGELSRIMLAVKAILAQYSNLPTIIFDEIDTGVSGEIANKMGEIMRGMSNQMQVFAITHLPQIAAKGNVHFKVFKTAGEDQTYTQLTRLSTEERVIEIAQMLSGRDVSDSAINHARALLN